MTLIELAEPFQDRGAEVAYNSDRPGSATMYFSGELVRKPPGESDERGTGNILFTGG